MATRNFIQKEAGTIAYQLREKHDLRGESDTDNPALAVSVVGSRTVTADELAKEIAASCTIKEADVAGVLTALSQRVQSTLLDGNRVELGAIGTLSVTLTCGNKHRADKVKARDISVRRIAFTPSKELSNAMRSAKMVSAGSTRTQHLTDEDITARLTTHFATNDILYRSEVESLCNCSRYRAMQIIDTLIEAGKLRAIGRRNSRHYAPAEGHFGK
ncbi:MAG: HU family DNA-binding protein [Bacteroidaceae bacterium]|nr:HU family DNA-binding protein [Bacteroidaceae bacterium]